MQWYFMRSSKPSKIKAGLFISSLNIANGSSSVTYYESLGAVYVITRLSSREDPAVMASVKVRNQLNSSAILHISKAPLGKHLLSLTLGHEWSPACLDEL